MARRQLTVRPSYADGSGNSAAGAKAVSATVLAVTLLVLTLLAQACSSSPPSNTATAEPTATTAPEAEPTATTAPEAEPTATTAPEAEPTAPTAVVSECGDTPVPSGILFVWGVADDDPDGGLVAHTGADVDSPVTRVLAPNAVAANQTGNCRLAPNGAPWFELADPASGGFDWVNARYVRQAQPSCLHGESYGSSTRDQANTPNASTQLFGPLVGHALAEGERVAFYADSDQLGPQIAPNLEFAWFPADRISVSDQCFGSGSSGPVCLFEQVVLFNFLDPEPRVNSDQSVLADRTGRLYARPAERGLREDFVEVTLPEDPGTYWYDPVVTQAGSAPCPADGSTPVSQIGAPGFDMVGAIDGTLINTLRPVGSGLYMTADWTIAAGEFRVALPPLDPGVYAVLFGSSSPTDGRYRAAGQTIRIYDPTIDPTDLPALTPQVWNAIELTD